MTMNDQETEDLDPRLLNEKEPPGEKLANLRASFWFVWFMWFMMLDIPAYVSAGFIASWLGMSYHSWLLVFVIALTNALEVSLFMTFTTRWSHPKLMTRWNLSTKDHPHQSPIHI